MEKDKKNPKTKNDNVIPHSVLEQKRKDSTIEIISVAKIFDQILWEQGIILPDRSYEEKKDWSKISTRKRVYIPNDSDKKKQDQ